MSSRLERVEVVKRIVEEYGPVGIFKVAGVVSAKYGLRRETVLKMIKEMVANRQISIDGSKLKSINTSNK